jgi:hypothetical protein
VAVDVIVVRALETGWGAQAAHCLVVTDSGEVRQFLFRSLRLC